MTKTTGSPDQHTNLLVATCVLFSDFSFMLLHINRNCLCHWISINFFCSLYLLKIFLLGNAFLERNHVVMEVPINLYSFCYLPVEKFYQSLHVCTLILMMLFHVYEDDFLW